MLKLYENIKKYRKALGLTQTELAELVGYTDGSMITKIESGKVDISRSKVYEFAKVLQTTPVVLMGLDEEIENENKRPRGVRIPVLGRVAAGTPILAVENHEDYFDTSEFINADFALQIQGDSMIGSRIYDGDIVFLRKQSYIENGQIGAFLIDGEATLKIFNKQNNTVMLLSSNPNYSPIILSPEKENIILGKLIGVYSRR